MPGERNGTQSAAALCARLGWDDPGSPEALADRWVAEMDRYGVGRSMLMASLPGDEGSVAAAVARHPGRIVGAFMVNPVAPDGALRVRSALGGSGLRVVCLFPAMHRYSLVRSQGRRGRRDRRGHAGRGALRALRRAVGRRAAQARARQPLRAALRPAARRAALRRRLPEPADHRAALRRRLLPRGADAGGSLPQRRARHVEHERLGALPPRADADRRVPHRDGGAGTRSAHVRHRLVVLPARLAGADLRHAARDSRAARHGGRLPRLDLRRHLQPSLPVHCSAQPAWTGAT